MYSIRIHLYISTYKYISASCPCNYALPPCKLHMDAFFPKRPFPQQPRLQLHATTLNATNRELASRLPSRNTPSPPKPCNSCRVARLYPMMASSRPPSPTTAQGAGAFRSSNSDAALVRRESELGRKCFICQCWESEDDPPHQDWVSPCQCSLAGHQECILEWVDSLRRENKPLKCPVCGGRIELVVPFDPAFWLSQRLRAIMCRTSPYFLIALFTGTTLAGSASYGLGALVVFAGPRDALRAVWNGSSPGLPWHRRLNWGPVIHLPFIGPVLVLNRILRLFSLYVTVPNLMVVCATAPFNCPD